MSDTKETTVKVEIDLADLGVQLDEEGQIVDRVEIVDLAIKAVTDRIYAEVAKDVKNGIAQLLQETAREKAAEVVSVALTEPVQLTTPWGQSKGEETTVREIVRLQIEEFLKAPASRSDGFGRSDQPGSLRDLIRIQVKECMNNEMNGAIANAKREVVDVVTKEILELTRQRLKK